MKSMQGHTNGLGAGLTETLSLFDRVMKAREWAAENVVECLDDCDEGARLAISPFGERIVVPCPLLSRECSRGRRFLAQGRAFAIASIPVEIPKRFRDTVGFARDTVALTGARLWNGRGFLYLYGGTGAGKSFAAAWRVYHDLQLQIEKDWSTPRKWPESVKLRAGWYSAFSVCLERQNLYAAEAAPMLILDDLGCEAQSPSNKSIINELVAVRYNEMRPTIITSNLNLQELEHIYGVRLYERVIQNGRTIDCGGYNMRLEGDSEE
ncbi:ATP-binding protein [Synergistes jonesii]|nr:ATP-binding protein [Synergistes jonesii]